MHKNLTNPNEHKIKIVFVGDCGVGKSSIISCYARQEFNFQTKSTIGVEFATREAKATINGVLCNITIQLWDTAGQERFHAIMPSYFKNALGVVFVYDMTKRQSFDNLNKWHKLIKDNCNQYISLLVVFDKKMQMANKTDLSNLRKVKEQQGIEWATQHLSQFVQVSSLNSQGIQKALERLVLQIVQKLNNADNGGEAGISRYSQASQMSRASRISKDDPYKDKEHKSCC